jgi:hypothetical protein
MYVFSSFGYVPWVNYQDIFQFDCTISHQQCIRIVISPHPNQYLLMYVFLYCVCFDSRYVRDGKSLSFGVTCYIATLTKTYSLWKNTKLVIRRHDLRFYLWNCSLASHLPSELYIYIFYHTLKLCFHFRLCFRTFFLLCIIQVKIHINCRGKDLGNFVMDTYRYHQHEQGLTLLFNMR